MMKKDREAMLHGLFGGPDRIRTDDPYNANVVRSQLRYRPISYRDWTAPTRRHRLL